MLHDALSHEGRDDGYVSRATAGARQRSILLSASGYASEHMASAFRHRARVLELGSPRNDVLVGDLANLTRERVRRALGIPPDSAVVLHAPTFRDGALRDASAGTPTRLIDLDRFHEEFGERAVLVLRRHFLDRSEAAIPASARGSVIDASRLPDVSALLCATDVLITDYSSVFFDFLCTGRPILFFAPDLDEYRDSSRGLYLEVSQLPGPMLTTNDELARAIAYALDRGVAPGIDLAAARETYCPHDDGHAARAVVDSVFGAGAR